MNLVEREIEPEIESLQFFLARVVDEKTLLAILSSTTGMKVDSYDFPNPHATAYAQVCQYDQIYPMGILVTYPSHIYSSKDDEIVLKKIAHHFTVPILLEPRSGEGNWSLIEPSGKIRKVNVDYTDDGLHVTDPMAD